MFGATCGAGTTYSSGAHVEQELLTPLEHMWSRNYLLFWSTCGAGTTYPSGAHELSPVFNGVHVARTLVFCVMFCRSLFVLLYFYFGHCVVCPSIC